MRSEVIPSQTDGSGKYQEAPATGALAERATQLHKQLIEYIAESDDAVSGAKGGDLGTVKRGQMVPAFEEAAFAMKAGELSEPVRSNRGFHIIKLESKTVGKSFDEAKVELERKMRPEAAQKAMEDLVKKGATSLDPEFFGLPKQ